MYKKSGFLFLFFLVVIMVPDFSSSQAPGITYYYNSLTELPWASCYLCQEGGSRQKIPFLPAVTTRFHRAPVGIRNYSRDIDTNGYIVFAGNGIDKHNRLAYNCNQVQ